MRLQHLKPLATSHLSVTSIINDRREWNEQKENRRKTKLEILRERLEAQRAKTEALKKRNDEKKQLIHDVMNKINDMFTMLDCSLEPFQHLLGDKRPSVHQLNLSLRLITDRIKEYKENVYYFEHCIKKSDKTSSSRLKKYTVQVEPPAFFKPTPIEVLVPADPCPSGSQVSPELCAALSALRELCADTTRARTARVHAIPACVVPRGCDREGQRYVKQ